MNNVFFISDWHIGHQAMCEFTNWDGTPARNFDTYEKVDCAIIENWNSIVSKKDTVYVLGDLAYSAKKEYVETVLNQLNYKELKLIGGNHDLWSTQWYLRYVKYIRGCMHLDNFLLTHIPVHPDCKGRFKLNIHGHIHSQIITKKTPTAVYEGYDAALRFNYAPDPFYYNVSVDHKYRYAPVPFEEIKEYYNKCLEEGVLHPIPSKSSLKKERKK